MKKTVGKMDAVNLNELISIVKPATQTFCLGAATVVLRRMGVPSDMIYKLVSAAIMNM